MIQGGREGRCWLGGLGRNHGRNAALVFAALVAILSLVACREKGDSDSPPILDTGTSCAEDAGVGGELSVKLTLDTGYAYAEDISEKLKGHAYMGIYILGTTGKDAPCSYLTNLCNVAFRRVAIGDTYSLGLPSGWVCVVADGTVYTTTEGGVEYEHSCWADEVPFFVADGDHVTDSLKVTCERNFVDMGSSD